MNKDSILKPASFLFVISAVVALINFSYNIIMGRMLNVSDFGDLRALFSMLMIIAVPVAAIQTMIAKFTAEYYQTNLQRLKSLTLQALALMLCLGLIVTVLLAGVRYPIAHYLKISSVNSLVLLGLLAAVSLVQPIMLGIYQGLQRFVLLGVNNLAGTVLKLLLGMWLVYLGYATLGALAGCILAGLLIILVFGLMLVSFWQKLELPKASLRISGIYGYSGYTLGVLICFSIISQIDILIVKNRFLPEEAGLYAAAAVFGKGFLFLPIPIVTVLFPRIVQNNQAGRSSLPILIQSLFISFLLCVIGIAVCFYFPEFMLKLFGNQYQEAAPLLKIFGLSMSPFALFYVVMCYFLSESRWRFFYYCLIACVLGVVILLILPQTLKQFLLVMGWYGLLFFILPLIYILWREVKLA